MRLLSLELERYGPFTDRRLAFPPEAPLVVVLGRNEAGKSSALAAVTDALFGFEHLAANDFLHPAPSLRVGARLQARDGRELFFRRRRGRKGTLLDAEDRPLPDEALAPFLGGLTRGVFRRAFGLDAATLRAGAEELLQEGGELGAGLFAAAAGLVGLSRLRRTLEEEAGQIFAERRAAGRRFYQSLDRFEAAQKAIRETELRAGAWKELLKEEADAAETLQDLRGRREALTAERARLQRLQRAAPRLRLLEQAEAAVAGLGALPPLPTGFPERLAEALALRSRRQEAEQRARLALGRTREALAAIHVDEALLARAETLDRLVELSGAYRKSVVDLPRVQAQADQGEAELAVLARRLGLPDLAALMVRQPSDAQRARLQALVQEGRDLLAQQRALGDAQAEAEARLALLQPGAAAVEDPQPLRRRLQALQPELARGQEREALRRSLAEERRLLDRTLAGLAPPLPADRLGRAPLPEPETLARFARRFAEVDTARREAQRRLEQAEAEAGAAELRLESLSGGRPLASPEAVAALRAARDAAWQPLRARLLDATPVPTDPAAVGGFEAATAAADRLADAASSDAARVAEHRSETRRLVESRQAAAGAGTALQALMAAEAETLADWRRLWQPLAVEPLSPAEMTPWLQRVQGALERLGRIERLEGEGVDLEAALQGAGEVLAALAAEAGLPSPEGPPERLARELAEQLALLDQAWAKQREAAAELRAQQRQLADLSRARALAGERLAAWSAGWDPALAALGLQGGALLEEAAAALRAWDEAPEKLRSFEKDRRRVQGMRRDNEHFEAELAGLLPAVAEELRPLPAAAAVQALQQRLQQARQAAARREAERHRLAEAEAELAAARQALAAAEQGLADLTAALPPAILAEAGPEVLLARLQEREGLQRLATERREALLQQAEGLDEAGLRAALAGFDADAAAARLEALRLDGQHLDRAVDEALLRHDRARLAREAREQGPGAELALQERRSAEAELAEAAQDWSRLKLAALLLGRAIERRRAEGQSPLLRRAGALFARLTDDSFAGVALAYDETDRPRLVGRRPTGAEVDLAGLSEGSRDQLFLALRLAYLEDYANRAEPAPFIADDLFATFDEARTCAALATLAEVGGRLQSLVFTHHRHVAEAGSGCGGVVLEL